MSSRGILQALAGKDMPTFEMFLRVMAIVTEVAESQGLRPIVVGGHAVSLYTRGDYATRDIDLVAPDDIAKAFAELGFVKAEGDRHWFHAALNVAVEVPSRHLAGSVEKVIKLDLGSSGHVYVIGIEDLILDRLRACVYWKSSVDCEWAHRLYVVHKEALDMDYLIHQVDIEPNYQEMQTIVNSWK